MFFSLICPCNDRALFDECVGASLQRQTLRDFELILVDTLAESYRSAAAALNAGAARARGEYLVFLHQDVCFDDAGFLCRLRDFALRGDFAIAGVAGAIRGKSRYRTKTRTNIVHGEPPRRPGRSEPPPDGAPFPCETLDECLFVIPSSRFRTRGMLEFMPTWHLYAVEYCLWAHANNAGAVLIFPLKLWHRSAANSLNANYFDAISALRRLYRRQFGVIYTTMAAWPTGALPFHLKRLYRLLKFRRARFRRAQK